MAVIANERHQRGVATAIDASPDGTKGYVTGGSAGTSLSDFATVAYHT